MAHLIFSMPSHPQDFTHLQQLSDLFNISFIDLPCQSYAGIASLVNAFQIQQRFFNILLTKKNTTNLVFKATTGGRNASFHTASWPPLVALTINFESYWTCGSL